MQAEQAAGKLTVRVYTSQAQIPIAGATVVVTAPGTGGKRKLLSVQATDRSGEIRPIQISTPVAAESTSPHLPGGEAPFAVCNVWAEHPGYTMLEAEGVQIFPGVETVQNMELIPLPRGQSSLQHLDVREIPPQSL